MHRRSFLQASAAASLVGALPRFAHAQQPSFDPKPSAGWRTFEITTRVELQWPEGTSRVWIPVPSVENSYQKVLGTTLSGNGSVRLASDGKYGANMVAAEWNPSEKNPVIEVVSGFSTIKRAVDLSKPDPSIKPLDAPTAAFYLAPTDLIPTDGIVRDTARDVTKGKFSELQKARAIYEWIVDNTARDPKVRGCGIGDIKSMLETGNLKGKCADLNALYVGLARASGLPARDVYGLRVAKSEFGYRSLGAGTPNVTRAQHCRAEVYLTGFGWVPVDPADVRKVVLEEPPGNLAMTDERVQRARARLLGSWEMNWIAYNYAQDVMLPASSRGSLPYFMYPQGETAKGRLDSLDPENFRYSITVKEVTT